MSLLPCPFCGGSKLHVDVVPNTQSNRRFVWCLSCSMQGPWSYKPKGAEEMWNTRSSPPEAEQPEPQRSGVGVVEALDIMNNLLQDSDAERWRFFRDEMDESDKLHMLANGTDHYDRVIDQHKAAERRATSKEKTLKQ